MEQVLSYGCKYDDLETEITINHLTYDSTNYVINLKKNFIRKIYFDYYSNIYVIKGYYPNNNFEECFEGVKLNRWAKMDSNHEDAIRKIKIRWVKGDYVDREINFNAYAVKYREEIDLINQYFYLLLVDVDREIGYNNIITVNNSDILYINIKPYRENDALYSLLKKLDDKYTSVSDLKGKSGLMDSLAKTGIATRRSIVREDYWEMKLLVFSLNTDFKKVSFELNINFNKNGYDGLVDNGRPLNILRRIISVLAKYISEQAVEDLEGAKKNLDIEKVLFSRDLKAGVKELIKREDMIIQPRISSINVSKNENIGIGVGTSQRIQAEPKIKWGAPLNTEYSSQRNRRKMMDELNNDGDKKEIDNNVLEIFLTYHDGDPAQNVPYTVKSLAGEVLKTGKLRLRRESIYYWS